MSVKVFFSYTHQDEDLRDKLARHLRILERQGIIDTWYDRNIDAGIEYTAEIDKHLNSADIILLLVSSDFLASDYCYDIEVKQAIKRHKEGEAKVIPIILRPVLWNLTPFGELGSLPKDGKPITSWSDQDAAFVDIVKGIQDSIQVLATAERDKNDRVYSALLRLGYRQQARLFREAIETESVAAFLIHGLPQHGQRWLLNRLVVRHIPDNLNSKDIKIDLGRLSMKTTIDALWRELGRRIGEDTGKVSPQTIANGVYRWWLTKDIIFVLHDAHLLQEKDIHKLIEEFWLPLTERVQAEAVGESDSKLLMFLVDYIGKAEHWNLPFVDKLDANWKPQSPIKSPRIKEFTETELIDWIDSQDSDLPSDLTFGISRKVEEILESSEGGVPELALREICNRCGLDWYEELDKWIRL